MVCGCGWISVTREADPDTSPGIGGGRRGSYDPEYENAGLKQELARLSAQATLSWPVERERLLALGLHDGMSVLDVGCGPGFSTQLLAELLPSSRITGVDSSPVLLEQARRRWPDVGGRVRLLQADVTGTGLPDGTFDFALSRYVFQHLADPVAAAYEVRRLLRPGGRHAVVDVDDGAWGIADPAFPEFHALYARAGAAQRRRGGNRVVGRELGRIMRRAGYTDVRLDVFAYDSDTLGLEPFREQLSPDRLLPLLVEGGLTVQELGLAHSLLDRFSSAPEPFVLLIGFLASGDNP